MLLRESCFNSGKVIKMMQVMKKHFWIFWCYYYFIAIVRSSYRDEDTNITSPSPTQNVIMTKAAINAPTKQQVIPTEKEVLIATTDTVAFTKSMKLLQLTTSSKSVTAYKHRLMHLQCDNKDNVIKIKEVSSWKKDFPKDVHLSENHVGSRFTQLEEHCNGLADCQSINARPEYGDMEHILYDCVLNGEIKIKGTSPAPIIITPEKVTVPENPVTLHQVTRAESESEAAQPVTNSTQPVTRASQPATVVTQQVTAATASVTKTKSSEPTKSVASKIPITYSVTAYKHRLMHLYCDKTNYVIKIKEVSSWNRASPQDVHFSDNRGGSRFRRLEKHCNGHSCCLSINARPEHGDTEKIFYECIIPMIKPTTDVTTHSPKIVIIITVIVIVFVLLAIGGAAIVIIWWRRKSPVMSSIRYTQGNINGSPLMGNVH